MHVNFNSMNFSRRTKIILSLIFFILFFCLNGYFFIHQKITPYSYFININDADRLDNGNTIMRVGDFQTAAIANLGKEARRKSYSGIIEINQEGEIVWQYTPDGLTSHVDHEIIEKDDGYFFIDSPADSICYVRKSTKEIEWVFELGDINWTAVNSSWDESHLFNNPCRQWNMETCVDWSHVNDLDFKDYGTWEGMLISIRNFNLIIEVNYTKARASSTALASDITWYYQGNLFHQHNPDYLPNGNIIIVDSDNQKFIEVNMTNNEIEWEWTHPSVTWPRDCDLMLDNCFLITDVDKVYILNRSSEEIIFTVSNTFEAYEADYIEDTVSVLISYGVTGILKEFDINTGELIWKWGSNVPKQIAYVNSIFLILIEGFWIYEILSTETRKKWIKILKTIPLALLICFHLFVMIGYHQIMVYLFTISIN